MKILIGLLLLITSLVAVYFASGWFSPSIPTDEELTARFLKDRDSLTKLQQLFTADSTLRYASPRTLHRDNGRRVVSDLTPPDEYRSTFDGTGILSGARSGVLNLEFIEFPTYRSKLDGGDYSQQSYEEKGYAFMLSPPERVQEILGSGNTYGNAEFKQIEGQWYIFHGIQVSKPE